MTIAKESQEMKMFYYEISTQLIDKNCTTISVSFYIIEKIFLKNNSPENRQPYIYTKRITQ
ncbi:hypothetical protein DFO77_11611 [Marinilabilia salmonicolor]|uniref:Uncharacterized protein n=1 Tax=Marinilabilia salmonicolor TaxID=989 RepID=A0A368UX19_9BACT|nr:hypothetical protein DFO77_11611 [Marinilabilia salmonicolor]